METFIAMFPLERQEVRKAIDAFANLLTIDQHRNILCSSMKLEDINEEVKLTIKEMRKDWPIWMICMKLFWDFSRI